MAVAYVTWSEQQAIETIDSTEIFTGKISAYTTYFTARPILVKDKYRVNPLLLQNGGLNRFNKFVWEMSYNYRQKLFLGSLKTRNPTPCSRTKK